MKKTIQGSLGLLGLILLATTQGFAVFDMITAAAVCFGLGGVLMLGSALSVVFAPPEA